MPVPPTVERVAAEVAAEAACRADFAYFLTWLRIKSEDPLHPGLIPLHPFPYQIERARAWQAGGSEVILKERQIGFSAVLVAPYMLWRAMYHGWTCGYWSVGQKEAREEISRIESLYESLPPFLRVPATIRVDDADFEGGGRIISFPSTEHAGISYTLHLAFMDEIAFHQWGAQNYAAIQPAVGPRQFVLLSTADPSLGPSGFFHDFYWASKRGETGYRAVFEARRRPDRDAEWYAQARRRYAGREEEFDAYYPETDKAAFAGRAGAAFPEFRRDIHVVRPFTIPENWTRWTATDYGYVDPWATLWLARSPDRRKVVVYREAYETRLTAAEQAKKIKAMTGHEVLAGSVGDPSMWAQREKLSSNSIADEYAFEGVYLSPANNDRLSGKARIHEALAWEQLAARLKPPRVTIFDSCPNLIRELETIQRSLTKPEDTETKGVSDHALDAFRYALMVEGQRGRPEGEAPEDRAAKLRQVYGVTEPKPAGSVSRKVAG